MRGANYAEFELDSTEPSAVRTLCRILCKNGICVIWFDVYTSEVDDHGVDFVAKYNGVFYEIQVKAVRLDNYMYIRKDKIKLDDKFLICYLRFQDGFLPDVYVFPSTVWEAPNALFVDYSYDKPEYGIKYNKRNAPLMEPYRAEAFFNKAALDLSKFADEVDDLKLSEEE